MIRRLISLSVTMIVVTVLFTLIATGSFAEPSKSRVVVSFYSIAAGPDSASIKTIDGFIAEYEKAKSVKLEKTVSHYGREGDFAYCFMLAELSKADQDDFVSKLKDEAKKVKQVMVEENAPCPSGR